MTVRELMAELAKCGEDEEVRMMSDPEGNEERPLVQVVFSEEFDGRPVALLWPGYDPPKTRK
jgi:hypothetical protein